MTMMVLRVESPDSSGYVGVTDEDVEWLAWRVNGRPVDGGRLEEMVLAGDGLSGRCRFSSVGAMVDVMGRLGIASIAATPAAVVAGG